MFLFCHIYNDGFWYNYLALRKWFKNELNIRKSGKGNEKIVILVKSDHLRDSCFKLKTCNECEKVGHIAKFCRESHESHSIESLLETANCRTCSDFLTLPKVNTIILNLKVGSILLLLVPNKRLLRFSF